MELERLLDLTVGFPIWKPADASLEGDFLVFRMSEPRFDPVFASFEDVGPKQRVPDSQEDQGRVGREGQDDDPPRQGQCEEDAPDYDYEQAHRAD
jgi:hypothetical protein